MRRSVVVGLLAYGLLLIGLLTVDGRFLALALPAWVYLGAALLAYPAPPKLAATRTIDRPVVTEGQPVTVTLRLRNDGERDALLDVADLIPAELPVLDGDVGGMALLSPGETMTSTYTLGTRRGAFSWEGVAVTASEPLDLLQQEGQLELGSRILVLPRVDKWRPVRLRPRRTLGFTGPIPSRRGGEGTDVHGVREYHPGDPLRRINWRATARYHDRAFTTEFEQERITDVGIILDLRRQCALEAGDESLLDHSVRAAAALSETLLRDGHRVGLLMYGKGQQWVHPGYGRVQQLRILQALAAATVAESTLFDSLRYLSTRLFPARSQLVFVSPLMPDDHEILFRLRSQAYSVLVVCPDSVAFEAEAADASFPSLAVRLARLERTSLLRRLQQGGIAVADWRVGGALEESLYAATVGRRR
jgi:uncharacterized protein (DUF58 family)